MSALLGGRNDKSTDTNTASAVLRPMFVADLISYGKPKNSYALSSAAKPRALRRWPPAAIFPAMRGIPFRADLQTRRLRAMLQAETEKIKAVREIRPIAIAAVQEAKRVGEETVLRAGIARLQTKLAQASRAVPEVTKHLEAHADRILSRRDEIMNRSDIVCAPHHSMMDETDHGLDDLEQVLQVMGNGGPLSSSESPEG